MLDTALGTFILAVALSLLLCWAVRRAAMRRGAVVPPRPDRWHRAPTPTMGGIGIACASIVAALIFYLRSDFPTPQPRHLVVPISAFVMLIIGVLDDRLQLSPLAKLVSSLIVGAFVVFAMGTDGGAALPWPATLVAIVWFGGVVHALNLLDNMDGLAGGIAMCATALLAYLFAPMFGPALVLFLTAVAGALLGFLYWNRPRARLFMGDSGSLFLGSVLAAASLLPLTAGGAFLQTAVVIGAVLVVPLFDTAFVLVLRRLAGLKATRGGTDHVSHRLASLGFSERSAVRILYLIGLSGGLMAFLVQQQGLQPMLPLAAMFGVGLVLVGVYLARVRAYEAEDFRALQKSSFAPFLKDLTFRWHAGQVLLDMVLIAVCFYSAYRIRFEDEALQNFLPFFTASLPIVLGCKLAALYLSGLYSRSWDTFGLIDLFAVFRGVVFGSLLSILAVAYVYRFEGFSRAVFIIDATLLFLAILGTRGSFRTMGDVASRRRKQSRRVLIYGAGSGGQLLVREMRANMHWNMRPVAFIDDDPVKISRYILGVPVRGTFDDLNALLQRLDVDDVVLSSAAINGEREVAIRTICNTLGKPVRRLHLELR